MFPAGSRGVGPVHALSVLFHRSGGPRGQYLLCGRRLPIHPHVSPGPPCAAWHDSPAATVAVAAPLLLQLTVLQVTAIVQSQEQGHNRPSKATLSQAVNATSQQQLHCDSVAFLVISPPIAQQLQQPRHAMPHHPWLCPPTFAYRGSRVHGCKRAFAHGSLAHRPTHEAQDQPGCGERAEWRGVDAIYTYKYADTRIRCLPRCCCTGSAWLQRAC